MWQLKHDTEGNIIAVKPANGTPITATLALHPLDRYTVDPKADAEGFHALTKIMPTQIEVNTFVVASLRNIHVSLEKLREELRGQRVEAAVNAGRAKAK